MKYVILTEEQAAQVRDALEEFDITVIEQDIHRRSALALLIPVEIPEDARKIVLQLQETRYLSAEECASRGFHYPCELPVLSTDNGIALLVAYADKIRRECGAGMLKSGFVVIDKTTNKEADMEQIALKEDWAKGLMYCDMEGFTIENDGTLLLVDECGKFAYCPEDRFEIRAAIEGKE